MFSSYYEIRDFLKAQEADKVRVVRNYQLKSVRQGRNHFLSNILNFVGIMLIRAGEQLVRDKQLVMYKTLCLKTAEGR